MDQRRFTYRSGRLMSSPVNAGWALLIDNRDPAIPNKPLEQQPFIIVGSTSITDSGEATTAQLTVPGGSPSPSFTAGRIQDDENPADSVDIGADGYTELEWCIQPTALAESGAQYEFRVVADDAALDTYSSTPHWTIGIGGTSILRQMMQYQG